MNLRMAFARRKAFQRKVGMRRIVRHDCVVWVRYDREKRMLHEWSEKLQ